MKEAYSKPVVDVKEFQQINVMTASGPEIIARAKRAEGAIPRLDFFCFTGAVGWLHRVGIVRIGGVTVGFFCFSMAMERHLWYNESRRNELGAAV